MSYPDPRTLERIQAARTYKGTPPDQYLVPYKSIADLLDQRTAETPDKVYLIHYDAEGNREEFTYLEFNSRVNQIANFMAERLDVKHGNRIATIGYNHSDTVMIYYAAWKLGAAVAPQNVAEDDGRINYILRNSEAVVFFARPEYLERAETIVRGTDHNMEPATNIRRIVQYGGDARHAYVHLQQEAARYQNSLTTSQPPTLESECLLVYTSGTTGAPKGVVLTHYNMLVDAHGIADWNSLTAEQRTMCVLPIHHVNGIEVTLVTPLLAGASTVLNRAYSSSHFWERIARENVQIVSVVPTLLQFSLEYADNAESQGRSIWGEGITDEDVKAFRHLICGAGTLAVALSTAFEEKFHIPILHGYGLSETTCYSCFLPADLEWDEHRHWMRDLGYPSIGVPIFPNEMSIFDSTGSGEQLDAGQRGEICIRGHNVMKYYFNRPDANAETFKFGWFRSGDEGFYELDDAGRPYFFITGRIKELINRGGVKFSPFDIEEVLLEIPQVKVGLAVAFENDYYGEEVGAYVVLNEGQQLSEQQVLEHCRSRMTFEKSPKVVIFGTEIPVTTTGKYQRLKLRDRFAEHKHSQFRPA
jgi:acyl-CoA synthetase (AMP-forming)/AMP-acid ligase II